MIPLQSLSRNTPPQPASVLYIASRKRACETCAPNRCNPFRDAPQFGSSSPANFLSNEVKSVSIMARARLDRHVIAWFCRWIASASANVIFAGRLICSGDLLLALLAQKFCKAVLSLPKVCCAQALPNFFVVAECPGIIAARLMAHQVLLASPFPTF